MKKIVSTFIFCLAVWLLLAGFSTSELILGSVVSLIIAFLLGENSAIGFGFDALVKSLKFVFLFMPIFLIELVKSNIDVALRVLSPQCPVNPGFVKIQTSLKGDFSKLILANSITLTPGTITLDADDNALYIHWIDVQGNNADEYQENISGKFERVLGGIFNDQ